MSKKIEELVPTDRIMIELGPKTQKNANSGEIDTIEPTKQIDVTYGWFLEATRDLAGYNERTGFVKTIDRTVKLVGMAEYEDQTNERGEVIPVPVAKEFATDASRDKLKKEAEKLLAEEKKTAEEAEQKRQDEIKAQAEFDEKAEKKRQAEAEQKRQDDIKAEVDRQVEARLAQNAQDSFETKQQDNAQAEQDKRLVEEVAARNAATKVVTPPAVLKDTK